MKKLQSFIFVFFFLGTYAIRPCGAVESATITGEVKNINPEARSLVVEQTDPQSGQRKSIYLASVLDSDFVGGKSLDTLKVGETVSVRVGYYQDIPGGKSRITTEKTKVEKSSKENLFEDVGKIDRSSVTIS